MTMTEQDFRERTEELFAVLETMPPRDVAVPCDVLAVLLLFVRLWLDFQVEPLRGTLAAFVELATEAAPVELVELVDRTVRHDAESGGAWLRQRITEQLRHGAARELLADG